MLSLPASGCPMYPNLLVSFILFKVLLKFTSVTFLTRWKREFVNVRRKHATHLSLLKCQLLWTNFGEIPWTNPRNSSWKYQVFVSVQNPDIWEVTEVYSVPDHRHRYVISNSSVKHHGVWVFTHFLYTQHPWAHS